MTSRLPRLALAASLLAALPLAPWSAARSNAQSSVVVAPAKGAVKGGVSTVVSPGSLVSSSRLQKPPAGSLAYALRYRSVSPSGAPIEVTGTAYVPNRAAPPGGWPVLSWAHPTTGIADKCAPSQSDTTLEKIVGGTFNALGIAFVESDYEGLGTPGRHPYLVGVSEGRGVIDAVRALRNVPGQKISNRFVVWGHSQGGHAALFAGQLAATWAPELKLLGVVAGAPPSQLGTIQQGLETSPDRGYLMLVAAGMQAAYPDLDLSKVLTPKGLEILPVVDRACSGGVFSSVARYPLADVFNLAGLQDPTWAQALAANEPGTVKIPAPVFIVHGDADTLIPVGTSATLMTLMCSRGTSVSRKVYAGADHASAALVSLIDVSSWLADRVLGRPAKNGCR